MPENENTTIFRTHKNEDPFVRVDKSLVNDSRLTWATRGLLVYLIGKPNDWEVRMSDLFNSGPSGRAAMRAMFKEAEFYGYLRRRRENRGKGIFQWVTNIYESPELNKYLTKPQPSTGLPSMVDPSVVEPSMGQPPTVNRSIYQQRSLPTNDLLTNYKIVSNELFGAAAALSVFVKVDGVEQSSQCRDHAHVAMRIAAHRFGKTTFPNGGFNAMDNYIKALPVQQLHTFCAWCHYTDNLMAAGDMEVKNLVAFVRGMTRQEGYPSFTPGEEQQFDARMIAYMNQLESDVWDDNPDTEISL